MSFSLPPLDLIIRFALPVPDLPLTIPSPSTTTPIHLLHQHIRPHLPPTYRSCLLRLIASGQPLSPSKPLSTSLRLPPLKPPSTKGKEKEAPAPAPIYIHCSISITQNLSAAALALEAASSTTAPPASEPDTPSSPHHASPPEDHEPRGFDRLLTAGLTHAEIASLRSQFLALTAHTHTPDTMPSPAAMRRLEERWLDSSGPTSLNEGSGLDGVGPSDDEDDGGRGALEDLLWGNLMGFFWPLGAAVWLIREEGVWSKRRQMSVVTGLLVNLAFGVLRMGLA
ncbi:MAG: hypothetical protein L6R40_005535 [Gallowayella cf. fulva]|nr:MAG: hypothetical protein L6R40_005535 [Xanthomendoza cf. fulva]